ncbi:MAG: hypothetical protein AB4911_14290 [Oscillochloridaceae bacterium umkhey_bin13]
MNMNLPTPLTDLRRRAPEARATIRAVVDELVGPAEIRYEFHREWNGCWKVRTAIGAGGNLEFTLLDTPGGGMLALPRPLPARLRDELGVKASDGSRWTLDANGALIPFSK